jgi:NTE family protein
MRLRRGLLLSNVLILSGLLLLWSWTVQSFSSYHRFAIDTLVLLSVFLLTLFGLRLRRRSGGRWAPAVFAAVGAWLILSALEPVTDRPLRRDPARFSRALRVATDCSLATGSQWRAERVGVALSGGGFRAAAFHAGVLHTLDRLGVPVTNVSTISGGSIIGAFYTLGGEPLDFVEALAQGSFNLRRHLAMAQNLLRLPSSRFSRLTAQADFLRRRLALADAERIRSNCGDCPRLILGATDLNFGMQVGFLDEGLLLVNEAHCWPQHHPNVAGLDGLDLATQVAISGAFPGAFPPYPVEITTRRQASNPPEPATIRRSLVLGDGGILDNTGLLLLRTAQQQSKRPPAFLSGWNVEVIVVSDAGALFGLGGDPGILASLQRSVDVLSARGSEGFKRREIPKLDLVWVSPQSNFTAILFDAPVRELSPEALIKVEQHRTGYWSSPFRFPDAILKALGEILLRGDKSAIQKLEAFLKERKARPGSPGTARDELRWRGTFRSELIRLSLVFRDTSTLRDQLGPGTTADLFALGQAQTLLNWPILRNRLNQGGSPRDVPCDPCEPPKREPSAGENGRPFPPPSRRGPGGEPPPRT